MKKLLLSVAVIATMGLASCGGADPCECAKEKSGEESAACKELYAEWDKKYTDAKTPEDKQKVLEDGEALTKDCK